MYKLKPVFSVPLELKNTCTVYKLKNLQEKAINVQIKSKNVNDDMELSNEGIEVLLNKEHEVLNKLMQLEYRLSKLNFQFSDEKDNLPIPKIPKVSSMPYHIVQKKHHKKTESKINNDIKNLIKTDIVVFADPENPPYSLLALPILWPNVSWDISYHIHSSVKNDLKILKTIEIFTNVSSKYNNNTTIKVFVIWQYNKPSPKIVKSSTDILFGEVQLLRLFNHNLTTETQRTVDQTNSDKILDLINDINCSTNDRTSELYNLITDSNTILDLKNIALWSLLYKKHNIPPNIEKWIEQMKNIIIS
ncbi:Hypothetical protein CINCED_3A001315 [Cinara cedri]|uniref:AIMP2 thioredoxin-like domain-containing protein n=1 Tax=Cinara cedri TaxID=506608 RepID=A0A5E4MQ38_9HEMI|nr:Hypothetical protein CINCED_3A001315 [Cinara cedri]